MFQSRTRKWHFAATQRSELVNENDPRVLHSEQISSPDQACESALKVAFVEKTRVGIVIYSDYLDVRKEMETEVRQFVLLSASSLGEALALCPGGDPLTVDVG
jgi:hypothetical protein